MLEKQNVFSTTLHSDHYSDCKSRQTGFDSHCSTSSHSHDDLSLKSVTTDFQLSSSVIWHTSNLFPVSLPWEWFLGHV